MIEWLYVIAGFLFALVVGGFIADMLEDRHERIAAEGSEAVSEADARAKRGNK